MLYTRYRPTSFADLVGQETTAQILKKAALQGKLAHSYLFTGPRGTGKTTTARLLAKIVNCQNLSPEGDCCQKCASCQAIDQGKYLDLIEIDAASNRGIDQIRELKERLEFTPSLGKYKVYIIDEVHMLTSEAFNALLKTLEEPPAHVIFVLATTEPHKLPATILSRCQRFDFHTGSDKSLQEVIQRVVANEGYQIVPEAAAILVQHSGGSYRDALSLLDVVVSGHAKSEKITEEMVRQSLGLVDEELLRLFLKGLGTYNADDLLQVLAVLNEKGSNLHYFIRELIMIIRDRLWAVLQSRSESHPLLNAEEWSGVSVNQLQLLIAWLLEADNQGRDALFPTLPLEIVIARWLAQPDVKSRDTSMPEKQSSKATPQGKVVRHKAKPVETIVKDESRSHVSEMPSLSFIQSKWPQFVQAVRKHNPHLFAFLAGSQLLEVASAEGSPELWIGVKFNFHKERIEAISSQETIRQLTAENFGLPLRVRCQIVELDKTQTATHLVPVNEVLEVFMGDLE